MEYPVFCQIWEEYVEKPFLRHIYRTSTYSDKEYLYLADNSRRLVYDKYETIKACFKKCYFFKMPSDNGSDEDCTINRHKRAAILTYAFNEVSPISANSLTRSHKNEFKVYLSNQYYAFYLGLCSLLLDYTPESITRVKETGNQKFFSFPIPVISECTLIDGSNADLGYIADICRDLFFSKQFRNFNVLTMANVYYLLELKFCCLNQSDLYPDANTRSLE